MKKNILISVLAIFMSLPLWAQQSVFDPLQDMDGVEFITLNQDMIEAAFKASAPEADLTEALEMAEALTIITIDRDCKKASRKASSILRKKIAKKYTNVVSTEEDDELTRVFSKDLGNDKNEYVVSHESEDDIIIVVVRGKLSSEDAKNMVKIKIQ